MQTCSNRWFPLAGLALLFAACSGGESVGPVGGDFLVLRTTPPDNGKLFLNEPIRIDFSNRVDLQSADLNTVSFQVFDLNGNPLNERPAGTFSVAASAGDAQPGRQLVFTPRFPTNNTYTDGGFKPGRLYVVQLVGGDRRNQTTLLDQSGGGLSQPVSFRFQTADGTTPRQLFSDTRAGGPRRVSFQVTPSDAEGVALNQFDSEPVEVRLGFDQPLNPADTNVPVNVSADPLRRQSADKGRIFLEFEKPGQPAQWIPATVDLEVNTREGSVVVLRPIGILPNNAIVRVIVENTVEDMAGESNVSDAAYERVFGTFTTRQEFEPQYDAIVERFDESSAIDLGAAFLEPRANFADGRISASFDFEGTEDRLTYRPSQREVVLDTNFTQITPENSTPINVAGGIFNFARVEIPEGVLVRGIGTNPMVWLVSGDFVVNGTLSVDGGDGARVDTLNSANFVTPGGIGVCGGGNGGRGSPNTGDRSTQGEPGFGPNQKPAGGGEGGRLSCQSSCGRGSAGGGGSYTTTGDPWYPLNRTGVTNWPQIDGEGGQGCLTRTLPGGAPGPRPFTDSREDNNFWGVGVNVFENIRITGELLAPLGGAGGGGGGDRAPRCNTGDPGFISDNKGGGGGAGAGVLVIKALGKIKIGPRGLISAEGGNGGGGEQAGGNNEGGGGGGGSGGMIVLMAGQGFEIFVHGDELRTPNPKSTYGEQDFSFAISADGGIGTQGVFSGSEIRNKYPFGSNAWNQRPTGGFGGLGLVQMMVPPGDDQADQTGNRLDDRVVFLYVDGNGLQQEVTPQRKERLIAWRGWPGPAGTRVDDNGDPVVLEWLNPATNQYEPNPAAEGDIRPSPVMLPSPFGAVSRARSRWIDLGFAVRERRDQTPGPNDPQTVVTPPGTAPRPDFSDASDGFGFVGTSTRASDAGYIAYTADGRIEVPVVTFPSGQTFQVNSVNTQAEFEGQPAYLIELATGSSLGMQADRYSNYRLEAVNAANVGIADFRILAHDGRFVFLEPSAAFPQSFESVRVIAKFFEVTTDGQPGLGTTYSVDPQGNEVAPISNVRIGFAFHTDPEQGFGPARWPNGTDPNEGQFEYDLFNPAFQTWLATNRPSYVQWDVVFNTRYHPTLPANSNTANPLSSELPLPALDYLVLPYRF